MGSSKLSLEALFHEDELYSQEMTEKQRSILNAAEDLFSESGYGNTSTAEIARKAKVTEKTLFRYFPSKQVLLRRVLFPILFRTIFPYQVRKTKGILGADYDSFEAFSSVLYRDRLKAGEEHGAKLKIAFVQILQDRKLRRQIGKIWKNEVWKDFVHLVDRLKQEKKIRNDMDSRTIARATFFCIAGYIFCTKVLAPEEEFDDEKELSRLIEVLSKGVVSEN